MRYWRNTIPWGFRLQLGLQDWYQATWHGQAVAVWSLHGVQCATSRSWAVKVCEIYVNVTKSIVREFRCARDFLHRCICERSEKTFHRIQRGCIGTVGIKLCMLPPTSWNAALHSGLRTSNSLGSLQFGGSIQALLLVIGNHNFPEVSWVTIWDYETNTFFEGFPGEMSTIFRAVPKGSRLANFSDDTLEGVHASDKVHQDCKKAYMKSACLPW